MHVQKAIKKWEAIRRHDADPKQRDSLVSEVLKEVGQPHNVRLHPLLLYGHTQISLRPIYMLEPAYHA